MRKSECLYTLKVMADELLARQHKSENEDEFAVDAVKWTALTMAIRLLNKNETRMVGTQ